MAKILLIDNYDSFTYNPVQYLSELGAELQVFRNDAISLDEIAGLNPRKMVISPGPRTPNQAGISLDLVRCFAGRIPLLGVCLGHQAIGQAFGGAVVRAPIVVHGKTAAIHHDGRTIYRGLPDPFIATRYHSLVVEDIPNVLHVNATSETPGLDGTSVMGFRHRELPIHGVQFHPESIATQHGHDLLANFLAICGIEARERQAA